MMKKYCLALLALCVATTGLFAFDVSVPNEVPAYKDLEVILMMEEGTAAAQARFYFLKDGNGEPLYAEFTQTNGVWSTVVPSSYLRGEELVYYTQVQTTKGKFFRSPATGYDKARLLPDTTPPSLKLMSPETSLLAKGKEQLVVFQIVDESGIADFEIAYNETPLEDGAIYKDMLAFLVTPPRNKDTKATVDITLVDNFNNKHREQFVFQVGKVREPFFSATADASASLDAEYTLEMGKTANTTDPGEVLADLQHDVTLDFSIGGETRLKAGPLALDLGLELADNISVFDLAAAYPNTLIADFQNVMNLWHPWNFADEFDYSGEEARKFYNDNQFYARLSILDPALTYTFGDQKISFQKETVQDFAFRGSALSLDIPLLNVQVGKGLSDLGLYQTAWPQNFFGLQAGINVFDNWWLQTNLSMISSLQGRYDDIASTGISPIGVLYDLGDVRPEENLVFGLDTGTDNNLFKLSAGLGLTLYADDASQIIDVDQLASDIDSGFDLDINPYLEYVDLVNSILPVFDYFPLSDGLAVKALNRELWGITYGADLEIPAIGLEGWFHKTDASYRSLGAAVDSDELDIGGAMELLIGEFNLILGYDFLMDNIPDILFNDLLPLVLPDLAPTADPTEDDIQNVVHTANFGFDTPPSGIFANLSFTYSFEYATTNAEALAALVDEAADIAAAQAAILGSTMNDTTLTHTGGILLKSGRMKFGDFIATLGAKTEDSFITYALVDGEADGSSIWEFSYALDGSLQYERYRMSLAFAHGWSTAAATDVEFGYDAKFTILKGFFDKITFDGSFDQVFNTSSLQQYGIGGGITLEKAFGILDTSIDLQVDFIDSKVDNSDDALTAVLTVAGGISL